MRQRNDTGSPLESHDLRRTIGPGEEFSHELPVPGCTALDEPEPSGEEGGGGTEKTTGKRGKGGAGEQGKETPE